MWQWSALVAMACFTAMQLIFAQVRRQGMDAAAALLWVFAFAAALYFAHVRMARTPLPRAPRDLALLAAAAALSYLGNLYSVRAVGAAPNPGYAVAIVAMQAAAVTVLAVGVLGSSLSWSKALGVLLCSAGVTLIVR